MAKPASKVTKGAAVSAKTRSPKPSAKPTTAAPKAPARPKRQATPKPAVAASRNLPAEALYFDASWYLERYPDVAAAGISAAEHFMTVGYKEGRDPNAIFSTSAYLAANPDINADFVNPFLHFVLHGAAEGRRLKV